MQLREGEGGDKGEKGRGSVAWGTLERRNLREGRNTYGRVSAVGWGGRHLKIREKCTGCK